MRIDCKPFAWLLRFSLCIPLLLGSWSQVTQAQTRPHAEGTDSLKSETIEIHFAKGSSVIDPTFLDNRVMIAELSRLVEEHREVLVRIEINSTASPEGSVSHNKQLAKERTQSIYSVLTSLPILPNTHIIKQSSGIAWDKLAELVRETDFPHHTEVLHILENTPEETWKRQTPTDRWLTLVDSRNHQLMCLRRGEPYRYMEAYLFPKLRSGSIVTVYYTTHQKIEPIEKKEDTMVSDSTKVEQKDSTTVDAEVTNSAIHLVPITEEPIEQVDVRECTNLLALKTNLLFDAMTLVNLELEVPIGNRWSIAGEFIFPWWTMDNGKADSKRNRIHLYNVNLEGKYWFGNRTDKPNMTGWFAGVYAGAGLYDLEYKAKGYQGEFFIMGGLSGGYAHIINKKGNLRMEYNVGIGYMQTDYRYYESYYDESYDSPKNSNSPHWHPVHQNTSRFTWIGNTKLKVSLVWMLNRNAKKEGVR